MKRQKELLRLERRKAKDASYELKKVERLARPDRVEGAEDPDIAGIVPGPQPVAEL